MWKVREVQHKELLAENRTRKQNSVCAPDYGIVSVNLTVSAFFFPQFFAGNISDEVLRKLTKSG